LGGVIGVALVQAILLATLRSQLSTILTDQQLAAVLLSADYINLLPAEAAIQTRMVYADATNLEFKALLGFAIAALTSSFFVWRRNKVNFQEMEDERIAIKNGSGGGSVTDSEDPGSCKRPSSIEKRRLSFGDEKHHLGLRERGSSGIAWSLLSHPIPDSSLFHPSELSCPSCGYKLFDSSSV
jgi:hypothetical protein